MSANFFESSHFKRWLLNVDDNKREGDENKVETPSFLDDNSIRRLHTYFIQLIQRVGTLLRLRQRAVATAMVYFKRTYTKKYSNINTRKIK